MNIAELFIRRPVMTTLVMLGILLFGVMGYRLLPISDLPNVDFPTIQVSAGLPGASPETMASSVATPLEKQFTTIAGLDNMNSTSTQGSTAITLQFNLSRSLDGAALDVQAAISAAARQLPPNMPSPPSFQKVNPADQPDPLPDADVGDAAAVRARRVRRGDDGAAHLDRLGSCAGPGVRPSEVRRARAAGSAGARGPRHRDRRGRRSPSRAPTSTFPPACSTDP